MVKLLFVLTVFFFVATSMFFVFLTKFNEESKRAALLSKVAGVTTSRIGGQTPSRGGQAGSVPTTKIISPTITAIPEPTEEPTATPIPKKILETKLGEMEIEKAKIEVKAVKLVDGDIVPIVETRNCASLHPCVGWQDFQIQLLFPEKVLPGSSDNKFIFQNKEYEIKVLNKKGD